MAPAAAPGRTVCDQCAGRACCSSSRAIPFRPRPPHPRRQPTGRCDGDHWNSSGLPSGLTSCATHRMGFSTVGRTAPRRGSSRARTSGPCRRPCSRRSWAAPGATASSRKAGRRRDRGAASLAYAVVSVAVSQPDGDITFYPSTWGAGGGGRGLEWLRRWAEAATETIPRAARLERKQRSGPMDRTKPERVRVLRSGRQGRARRSHGGDVQRAVGPMVERMRARTRSRHGADPGHQARPAPTPSHGAPPISATRRRGHG